MTGQESCGRSHSLGPKPAVQPDCGQRKRLERRQYRAGVGAGQRAAVRGERDLRDDRHASARTLESRVDRHQHGLQLEHVLAGLHDEAMHAAGDQPVDLRAE
jgi:hypothetical protein